VLAIALLMLTYLLKAPPCRVLLQLMVRA
jgi:hypothetical protein